MTPLTMLLSQRCCGGPVLILSSAFGALGVLFAMLSAAVLGVVFITIGIATLALCMVLGQSRCARRRHPL